jgi:hypothetical protein
MSMSSYSIQINHHFNVAVETIIFAINSHTNGALLFQIKIEFSNGHFETVIYHAKAPNTSAQQRHCPLENIFS